MELKGKKIAFLGDSITEGAGASSGETNFVSLIAKNEGVVALNYGIGGTRIARQTNPTFNKPRHDLDFIMRADEIDKSVDAVVVFGGTNDFGHGDAVFGNEDDTTIYSFCGACNMLFGKLNWWLPNAVKVAITPLGREDEQTRNPLHPPLSEYAAKMKEIAQKYGWHVLDIYSLCKTDPDFIGARANLCDGLHPNDAGYAYLAKGIAKYLKSL